MATEEALQVETEAPVTRDAQPVSPAVNPTVHGAEREQTPAGLREISDDRPPATLRSLSAQAAHNAALELEHLKKLLIEQDAAKRQAQKMAAQTDRQWRVSEAEISRIRGDLKRTQDQLAFAKQEHNIETQRAAEREANLRNELVEMRTQATKALDSVSGHKKTWRFVLLGIAALAILWCAVTFLPRLGSRTTAAREEPPDEPVAAVEVAPATGNAAAPPARDFSGASDHLDQALSRFKGEKPEAVLERVHKQYAAKGISVCSFAWNNGQVSLLFGNKEGMDVDTAMARCADAVDKAGK
jgi:hypothetical protein